MLYREGFYVLSAQKHNSILCPAGNLQLSIVGEHAQVAGIKPPLFGKHRRGKIRFFVVSTHNLWAPYMDLAHGARRQLRAFLADYFALGTGKHLTHRPGYRLKLASYRQHRSGLGKPVPL